MRLWHKELINVLPRQQLLSQWRELCSIFVKEDKHILINFIYDYNLLHLAIYSNMIKQEFYSRGYKIREQSLSKEIEFFKKYNTEYNNNISIKELYNEKMNNIYLKQCLYNLEEKAMCGGILKEEWNKIYEKFKDRFVLERI